MVCYWISHEFIYNICINNDIIRYQFGVQHNACINMEMSGKEYDRQVTPDVDTSNMNSDEPHIMDPKQPLLKSDPLGDSKEYGYGTVARKCSSHETGRQTKSQPRRYYNELTLAFICCMNGMSGGFVLGFPSPTVPMLKKRGLLTDAQSTWYESLSPVGATVGSLLVTWFVQALGRKTSTIISAVPFVIGWFCLAAADSYELLFVGQFFTGLAGGMMIIACGLYLVESLSHTIRGTVLMGNQCITTLGILILYSLGLVLNTNYLAMVAMFPTAVMIVGVVFLPESPRWLMKMGRHREARAALTWLRQDTDDQIQREINEIQQNLIQHDNSTAQINYKSDLQRLKRPLAISITLFLLQQYCGYGVVLFNTQEIFEKAGFQADGEMGAGVPSIIVAAGKLVSTMAATPLLDRFGRRPFFITCGVLLTLSSLTLGLYFYFQESLGTEYAWIALVSLMVYTAAYSVGWGSIPFIVSAEIIPSQFRGWASGCSVAITWISSFVILSVYQFIVQAIGWYGLFWCFGGICFLGILFGVFILPETKLRSLENIEHEFSISLSK